MLVRDGHDIILTICTVRTWQQRELGIVGFIDVSPQPSQLLAPGSCRQAMPAQEYRPWSCGRLSYLPDNVLCRVRRDPSESINIVSIEGKTHVRYFRCLDSVQRQGIVR